MILIKSTWNGQDLFWVNNYGPSRLGIYCTERVRQIAEEHNWINVEFIEVKAVY